MRALLISRPGDFGVLEDHWDDDPLLLPLPGGTVLDLHEASLKSLGITEVRLLKGVPAGTNTDWGPLEARLQHRAVAWTVRSWPLGPWPAGWTLSQALLRQGLFLEGHEAVIFWATTADPRGWTGPKVPAGFPPSENPSTSPKLWDAQGKLVPWDGPVLSLGGTRDFFRASMRFLETLPPAPLTLAGIHRSAVLEAPLSLGRKVRAAARSRLGPLLSLAAGSQVPAGATLSRTLVLTPTRFTKDFALADKIVVGDAVVEPLRGEVIRLPAGAYNTAVHPPST